MTIGERIKYFRTEKGITQERLASELYISYQAISKWERNESLPDISILPKLSKALDVSCDAILLEDTVKLSNDVEMIINNANKEELSTQISILEKAIINYPNNEKIIMELIQVYSKATEQENWSKHRANLINYAEYIIKTTNNLQYKYKAIQILCYIYRSINNFERIKELANTMPSLEQCKEALLYHSMQGEQYKKGMHDYIIKLIDILEGTMMCWLYPQSRTSLQLSIEKLRQIALNC